MVQLAKFSCDRSLPNQAHQMLAFVQETIDIDHVALLVRRLGFIVEFGYAGLTLPGKRNRGLDVVLIYPERHTHRPTPCPLPRVRCRSPI
jgi:hypothetical protein